MITGSFDEFRVVHLSDLHFTGRPISEMTSKFWKHFHLDSISLINLRLLLSDILLMQPNHIIITGDITNTAHPVEFQKAKEWLLDLQSKLWPGSLGVNDLHPDHFTIVPGNHDISRKPDLFGFRRRKSETSRLKLFMETFGSTLGIDNRNTYDYSLSFPSYKKLFDCIDVFSLNSTVNIPVEVVGLNASGEIGTTQMIRLAELFNKHCLEPSHFRIVLCHHHPLIIPYKQESDIVEYFMAMRDASRLLRVCFDYGTHLLLHGHKHVPFVWSNQIVPAIDPPHQMTVVCAGSATHERTGSSQVYNQYIAIRKRIGKRFFIEKVNMGTRQYDPRTQSFREAGPPIVLYQQEQSDDRRRFQD